jgi:hypothetical protein
VEEKHDDEEGVEDKNMDHYMLAVVVVAVAMHPTFYSSI